MLGSVFTLLVRLLVVRVSDATCGFKAYRRAAARELFGRSRVPGWSFDAELLCIARRLNLRVAEVPVAWSDVRGSKVDLRRDVIGSLLGLLRIRANLLSGAYAEPAPVEVDLEVWSNQPDEAS